MAMGPSRRRVNLGALAGRLFSKGHRNSRGSLTVEAAIIVPILLFICAGLLGLSVRLSNYMYLNQIGRELVLQMGGIRCLAASTPSGTHTMTMGPSTFSPYIPTEGEVLTCLSSVASSCPAVGSGCPINVLRYYAANLIKSKPIRVSGDITMQYSFDAPASNPSSGICLLTIRFTAQDSSWMNFIGGPITTFTQGPYLSVPVPAAGNACVF